MSETVLRSYALGDCDDPTREDVEQHLAECRQCEETLAALDDTADSLVRHLPLVAGEQESAASQPPPPWLERLRTAPPAVDASEPSSGVATDHASDAVAAEGSVLSAYELLGVLGRGGMGIVYRARHRQLDRVVAFKVLDPRLTSAAESRRRFDREIRILGNLQHPGIVMATDAGRVGSAAYLVMELVGGVDLARLVRRGGPLSVSEACETGRQIALALAAAHRAGVIHRDLKPSNVMVDREGQIKLLDFGLSQLAPLPGDHADTSLGQLLGTLAYMAPEQAAAKGLLDHRTDLYGLGGTLLFLLTGRPPRDTHQRRSLLEQLRALSDERPPSIGSLRNDLPEALAALVDQLLDADPRQRGDSAEAVAEQLARWAGGDLSARVDELQDGQQPADVNGREVAECSLAQLLAASPGTAISHADISSESGSLPYAVSDGSRKSTAVPRPTAARRKSTWFVALATAAAAVWIGITILVQTPDGTLRIESDVDDVRVEVIDERDRVRELTIDRKEQETLLSAGRYRIRLAESYDHLEVTPSVITLQGGGETLARIEHRSAADESAQPQPATEVQPEGAVFQGDPISVWQDRFDSERDAAVKLQAAQALANLAGELPVEQRLDRLVEIGAEVLDSGFGDRYWLPALRSIGRDEEAFAPHWPRTEEVRSEFSTLSSELLRMFRDAPTARVFDRLGQILLEGDSARAGLAAWMLARQLPSNDVPSMRRLHEQLDRPVTELDQIAIATLLRTKIYWNATSEQQESIVRHMNELADRLLDPTENSLQGRLRSDWLERVEQTGIPADSMRAGQLVYEQLTQFPSRALRDLFEGSWFSQEFPYNSLAVEKLRENAEFFLPAWIDVVNPQLENGELEESHVNAIVRSLDYVLRVRMPEDDWDIETTATLLTERLRAVHSSSELKSGTISDVSPAVLLTNLLRMGKEIPDFAKTAPPALEELLAQWEQMLDAGNLDHPARQRVESLIELAPYRAVELLVQPRERLPLRLTRHGLERIGGSKPWDAVRGRESKVPPVDPLLLLAILAELSGESAEQDQRIAQILGEPHPSRILARHIRDLLGQHTALVPIAQSLLQRINERAIDERLRDAAADLGALERVASDDVRE